MLTSPIIFTWDGESMVPWPRYAKLCDKEFTVHENYRLEVIEERSAQIEFYTYLSKCQFNAYRDLLEAGWPRELARMCLPLSTYSHMFAKIDLHNLFHFLNLRCHSHAQYEIRVYAEAMLELVRAVVPEAVKAWEAARA